MSKGNTFEADFLALIFNATTIANIAINATASPLTNLEVSLHTADPGETGNQTTSECAYTGYARVPIARSAGGWTVSGTAPTIAGNAVAVTFPACSALTSTATYVGLGTDHSGTGKLLYSGILDAPLAISAGITPSFAVGTLKFSED